MSDVVPAILESEVKEAREKVKSLKSLERVHVDIIDGLFANNLTITPSDFSSIEVGELKVDYHLMVDDPMAWVEECVNSGADRIISQVERMGSQVDYVKWVKGYDVEVGLALDLYTPIGSISSEIIEEVDAILILGVKAGFGGQEFREVVVDKVENLARIYDGSIIVDGGVDPNVYRAVVEAGASEVAVNSYLWEAKDIKQAIKEFK